MAKGKDAEIEDVDEAPGKGRTLPGMEYKAVKPLINFGNRHEATKDEHRILTDRLEQENDEGLKLYEKYKEHFSLSPKKNGNGQVATYEAAGVRVTVNLPEPEPSIQTKRIEVKKTETESAE